MTSLEQLVDCSSYASRSIDSYAIDTGAMYTPLPNGGGFGNGCGGYGAPMRPTFDLYPVANNIGLGSFEPWQPPRPVYEPPQIFKNIYATPSNDYGYGTIESVNVDYGRKETFKVYTDILNNNINVGYEAFGTNHRAKSILKNFENSLPDFD